MTALTGAGPLAGPQEVDEHEHQGRGDDGAAERRDLVERAVDPAAAVEAVSSSRRRPGAGSTGMKSVARLNPSRRPTSKSSRSSDAT